MLLIPSFLAGLVLLARLWTCSARTLGSPSSSDPPPCNDPARERLEKLWRMHGDWHESIFQLENMDQVGTSLQDIDSKFVDIKRHALRDSSCPHGSGSDEELEAFRKRTGGKTSMCPSHDLINYDENRIPSTLFEKQCSCEHCGFLPSNLKENSTLGCKQVLYYAKVLRRASCDEGNNVYVYRASLEPLVMACVCDHVSRHTGPDDDGIVRSGHHVPNNHPPGGRMRQSMIRSVR